jgi:hypothetical protein
MKLNLVISFLLLSTCFAAFGQEEQSAVVEKGLIKVSIMYPFAEARLSTWSIMKLNICLW